MNRRTLLKTLGLPVVAATGILRPKNGRGLPVLPDRRSHPDMH